MADLSTPCILWVGATTNRGYGQRRVNGRVTFVHRAAWEEANGPIPAGLTIDHLCRVKLCLNVRHMEVVTRSENTRRGNWKELCIRGHRLAETRNAWGNCAECNKINVRMWRRRKSLASDGNGAV